MRQVWIAGLVLIGAIAMSGCVAEKKYKEALTETETAKTELERTRAQKNALGATGQNVEGSEFQIRRRNAIRA